MMATLRRARVMKPMPKGRGQALYAITGPSCCAAQSRKRKQACDPNRRGASGLRRRGAMCLDQALERVPRSVGRARIPEQPPVVMCGEDDPEQLEGELPGICLRLEVPLVDREADRLGDRAAQLALPGDEQIAHRAGAIVVFARRGEQEAPARRIVVPLDPGEPVREKGPQTRQAARLFQRGRQYLLEEEPLRLLESL